MSLSLSLSLEVSSAELLKNFREAYILKNMSELDDREHDFDGTSVCVVTLCHACFIVRPFLKEVMQDAVAILAIRVP